MNLAFFLELINYFKFKVREFESYKIIKIKMTRLSHEDMRGVGEFDERYVIKVNKENLLLLKSIFTPDALKTLISELRYLKINPLPSRLEVFLLNFIECAYREEYEERFIEKMALEVTQNNSRTLTIREIEDIEKRASEEYQSYRENTDVIVPPNISENPNIRYDLPYPDLSSRMCYAGRFFKINNRIYYVLGSSLRQAIKRNIAYDLTDLPLTLFFAYVVLSCIVDTTLLEKTRERSCWEHVFHLLLDPRLQEECFKFLEISKVCKRAILDAWTYLLKYYFQDDKDRILAPFKEVYSESGEKTETFLERDSVCNLLEFLGVDQAASLAERSTSFEGIKEVILSLERVLERTPQNP
jgi:hypothetical protein